MPECLEGDQRLNCRFAEQLKAALVGRYGHLPSTRFVAREFNLRHLGGTSISSESVRRWQLGLCIPHQDRLHTLSVWLGIQVYRFDSLDFTQGKISRGQQLRDLKTEDLDNSIDSFLALSRPQQLCLLQLVRLMAL